MVLSHESNKFYPESDAFYLKESDSKAFMQPVLVKEDLMAEMIEAILQRSFTLKEWQALFEEMANEVYPDWLAVPPPTCQPQRLWI